MSPTIILGILLAIAISGDGILFKMYVGAEKSAASAKQALESFTTEQAALGKIAQDKADKQKADDDKRKKDADAENAATHAADQRTIAKLRADADRTRGNLVPAAPPGSKCPPDQACFDSAAFELALRSRRDAVRGLADEGTQVTDDLNTARLWAQRSR